MKNQLSTNFCLTIHKVTTLSLEAYKNLRLTVHGALGPVGTLYQTTIPSQEGLETATMSRDEEEFKVQTDPPSGKLTGPFRRAPPYAHSSGPASRVPATSCSNRDTAQDTYSLESVLADLDRPTSPGIGSSKYTNTYPFTSAGADVGHVKGNGISRYHCDVVQAAGSVQSVVADPYRSTASPLWASKYGADPGTHFVPSVGVDPGHSTSLAMSGDHQDAAQAARPSRPIPALTTQASSNVTEYEAIRARILSLPPPGQGPRPSLPRAYTERPTSAPTEGATADATFRPRRGSAQGLRPSHAWPYTGQPTSAHTDIPTAPSNSTAPSDPQPTEPNLSTPANISAPPSTAQAVQLQTTSTDGTTFKGPSNGPEVPLERGPYIRACCIVLGIIILLALVSLALWPRPISNHGPTQPSTTNLALSIPLPEARVDKNLALDEFNCYADRLAFGLPMNPALPAPQITAKNLQERFASLRAREKQMDKVIRALEMRMEGLWVDVGQMGRHSSYSFQIARDRRAFGVLIPQIQTLHGDIRDADIDLRKLEEEVALLPGYIDMLCGHTLAQPVPAFYGELTKMGLATDRAFSLTTQRHACDALSGGIYGGLGSSTNSSMPAPQSAKALLDTLLEDSDSLQRQAGRARQDNYDACGVCCGLLYILMDCWD